MFKKFLSSLGVFLIFNLFSLPLSAQAAETPVYYIKTSLSSELNVNNSSKGQIVQFVSQESIKTKNGGAVIPKGTLFNGKISALKKSRFGFRRAKAAIDINEIVLPDGRKFAVSGRTQRHVYKGSAAGNVLKGIIGAPAALVVLAAGAAVIIIETCTIIGVVLIPATAAAAGGTAGKLTNGVNCRKDAGSDVKLQVKIPSGIIFDVPVNNTKALSPINAANQAPLYNNQSAGGI